MDDNDSFDVSCAVRANIVPANSNMKLNYVGKVFAKEQFFANGRGDSVFEQDNFNYKFSDLKDKIGEYEEFNFSFGDDKFSPIAKNLEVRNSVENNGLYDGSFEFDYFGNFVDTVQSYCYAMPWFMPFAARIVNDRVFTGKKAVLLTMNSKDEMLLKQSGVAYAMKKGEKWRISIQAAAENLKTYRMSLKLNMPNMGQIYIPIDNGTYDYRKFEAEFEVMSDSPNFDIILGGKGPSGKIWFDDIKFERVK